MATMKTKRVKTPIDECKKAERELKRLRKQVEQAELDLRMAFDMEKELRNQLAEAAKMVAVSPDPVGQVVAGAMELIRRHFPEATSAALYIHSNRPDGKYIAAAQIPIQIPDKPAPTAESLKSDLKRYADANHAGWDRATIAVDKGTKDYDQPERGEFLLVEPEPK